MQFIRRSKACLACFSSSASCLTDLIYFLFSGSIALSIVYIRQINYIRAMGDLYHFNDNDFLF
jgi:hypothetical protein